MMLRIGFVALVCAAATGALAQTASPPAQWRGGTTLPQAACRKEGATVSEAVVTASRIDLLGRAMTASQGEVPEHELVLRPSYRVGQLLESVPGLVVTAHSGEGKAYQYLTRGFNLDHGTDIANFIDDEPVNRPTNAHGQGYSDLNFIIPQVLEGLAYTKGPYYPAIGDFGDGASVHMHIADEIPSQISFSAGTLGDYSGYIGGTHVIDVHDRLYAAFVASHVDGPFVPGGCGI